MPLKIFIGSSGESKGTMDEIAEWIEDIGHTPCLWTDHTLFPLGSTTFGSLHQVAQQVDAALFIFSEDDTVWYRGDKSKSPRDNVLLEYGLFSGVLGERSVAIGMMGQPKLSTDLLGITYLSLNRKASAKNKLKTWLTEIMIGDGRQSEISRLRSPFQSAGKQSLFEQGTTLIRRAQCRVALVAKTPIPIVGTRPYGQPNHAIQYEKAQFEEYTNLARAASGGATPEFCCVGSISALSEDIQGVAKDEFSQLVRSNLNELYSWSQKPGSKFQLRWCETAVPMTFVVADDTFLIWFKDGSGENVWITAENDVIARALWDQAHKLSREISVPDIEVHIGSSAV
jgi:Predicted nucleotide-binding protein containing TIR-like domain